MYKFDTHVHTSEVSGCAHLNAVETVKLYKEKNFDGIVITDHYTEDFFRPRKNLPWEQQINEYLRGYYNALEYGKTVGMTVLAGTELRLKGSANEYLLFGMNWDLYIHLTDMYNYTLEQLREVTKKHGIIVFQAHPFRNHMVAASPDYVDGCEVYNGNPRHNSRNDTAEKYAEQNGLLKLSGSDCHQREDAGQGGIIIRKCVTSTSELICEVAEGRAVLIKNGVAAEDIV